MNQVRYKIAEAARMTDVSSSTLRLWESQGLIEPVRSESGQRLYEPSHIEQLKHISFLRNERGLNPAAIKANLRGTEADADEMVDDTPAGYRVSLEIGRKLRHLRKEATLTLERVSQETGIPVSALSTFERTSQGLSFTSLHELVAYFGTTLSVLTGQEDVHNGVSLIRHGEWSNWPPSSSGVTVQNLSEGKNQMECHRFVLAPGASSEGAYEHAGEEFLHVLQGSMEIVLDGDQFYDLNAGDSFYFESRRPHSWRNSSAGETILIWINTPPTF